MHRRRVTGDNHRNAHLCATRASGTPAARSSSSVFPYARASGCAKKLLISSSWFETTSPCGGVYWWGGWWRGLTCVWKDVVQPVVMHTYGWKPNVISRPNGGCFAHPEVHGLLAARDADEVAGDDPPLVDQLVERVLAVGARLAEVDLAGLSWRRRGERDKRAGG